VYKYRHIAQKHLVECSWPAYVKENSTSKTLFKESQIKAGKIFALVYIYIYFSIRIIRTEKPFYYISYI
jgi:hypothetical protein